MQSVFEATFGVCKRESMVVRKTEVLANEDKSAGSAL